MNNKGYSVSDLQKIIYDIYKEKNDKITYVEDYIFGYLTRTSAFAFKKVYNDAVKLQSHNDVFIKPISWIFALANEIGIDVEEAFLRRFPGICPYCLTRVCVCYKTNKKPYNSNFQFKIQEELDNQYDCIMVSKIKNEIVSLEVLCELISDIYPFNTMIWHEIYCQKHFNKVFEELAEVHEAYCRYKIGNIKLDAVGNEIADVFAWLLDAWRLSTQKSEKNHLTLEFINYYKDNCPVCKNKPCTCENHYSRGQGLMTKENALIYKDLLIKIKDDSIVKHEIEKVIILLDKSIINTKDNILRNAISQAKSIINTYITDKNKNADTKKYIKEKIKTIDGII